MISKTHRLSGYRLCNRMGVSQKQPVIVYVATYETSRVDSGGGSGGTSERVPQAAEPGTSSAVLVYILSLPLTKPYSRLLYNGAVRDRC